MISLIYTIYLTVWEKKEHANGMKWMFLNVREINYLFFFCLIFLLVFFFFFFFFTRCILTVASCLAPRFGLMHTLSHTIQTFQTACTSRWLPITPLCLVLLSASLPLLCPSLALSLSLSLSLSLLIFTPSLFNHFTLDVSSFVHEWTSNEPAMKIRCREEPRKGVVDTLDENFPN